LILEKPHRNCRLDGWRFKDRLKDHQDYFKRTTFRSYKYWTERFLLSFLGFLCHEAWKMDQEVIWVFFGCTIRRTLSWHCEWTNVQVLSFPFFMRLPVETGLW